MWSVGTKDYASREMTHKPLARVTQENMFWRFGEVKLNAKQSISRSSFRMLCIFQFSVI